MLYFAAKGTVQRVIRGPALVCARVDCYLTRTPAEEAALTQIATIDGAAAAHQHRAHFPHAALFRPTPDDHGEDAPRELVAAIHDMALSISHGTLASTAFVVLSGS